MKEMLEKVFNNKLLTSFVSIDAKVLKIKKKVTIFTGVDTQSYYHLALKVHQKSRFILKNVQEIIEVEQKIVHHVGHIYKRKHILLEAPLCSKAALLLSQNGWKVY